MEKPMQSQPGDLAVVQFPDGVFRLCEWLGGETYGFGDVVLNLSPSSKPRKVRVHFREGRNPAVDALIGKSFESVKQIAAEVMRVDPVAVQKQIAAADARNLLYRVDRGWVEKESVAQ